MLKNFGHFENMLMLKKIEQFGNFLPDNFGQIMKKKKRFCYCPPSHVLSHMKIRMSVEQH
jgi:hypothetical protein